MVVSVLKSVRLPDGSKAAFEAVFDQALSERQRVEAELSEARVHVANLERRFEELARGIGGLLQLLPDHQRAEYTERAGQPRQSRPARGTPIYDNVIELFRENKRPDWSAPDLQAVLKEEKGIDADPRQIHNILGYLHREGRLKRVGRGRYVVIGLGVQFDAGIDIPGTDNGGRQCDE